MLLKQEKGECKMFYYLKKDEIKLESSIIRVGGIIKEVIDIYDGQKVPRQSLLESYLAVVQYKDVLKKKEISIHTA